jgi:hypothetical protein
LGFSLDSFCVLNMSLIMLKNADVS